MASMRQGKAVGVSGPSSALRRRRARGRWVDAEVSVTAVVAGFEALKLVVSSRKRLATSTRYVNTRRRVDVERTRRKQTTVFGVRKTISQDRACCAAPQDSALIGGHDFECGFDPTGRCSKESNRCRSDSKRFRQSYATDQPGERRLIPRWRCFSMARRSRASALCHS